MRNERRMMEGVVEMTKVAQQKGSDPLLWALQMYSNLNSAGESLPSVELAEFLVSYICWDNNVPILWKFLEKALTLQIVPPTLLLALLSVRFSFPFSIQPIILRDFMQRLLVIGFKLSICTILCQSLDLYYCSVNGYIRFHEWFNFWYMNGTFDLLLATTYKVMFFFLELIVNTKKIWLLLFFFFSLFSILWLPSHNQLSSI